MRTTSLLLAVVVASFSLPAAAGKSEDALAAAVKAAVDELAPKLEERGGVIAVPPFRAAAEAEKLELGAAFGAAVVTELKKRGFDVRDAAAVEQLLGNAATEAGLGGDSAKLQEIASNLGAKTVLIGQVGALGDSLTLDLKAVDPESAAVAAAANKKTDIAPFRGTGKTSGTAAYTGGGTNESVEIAMRRLGDELAQGLRAVAKDGDLRYVRAGVMPFEEAGDQARKKELGTVVPSEISTIFRRDHGVLLVERSQLDAVLSEQAIGQTGAIDPSSAAQVGQILGIDYLVIGTVSEVGDHFRVNASVVDAVSGKVVAAANRTIPAAGLIALSADAVVLRSRSGAAFRSFLIPGWGQFYNREPVKGSVFLGAEAAIFGGALAFHFLGANAEKEYHLDQATFASRYQSEVDSREDINSLGDIATELRTTAETRYKTRNTFLFVAAGLWGYNLLDAYLNGVPANATGPTLMVAPTADGGMGIAAGGRF